MKKLFKKFSKNKQLSPPMLEWSKLVELLYDKDLNFSDSTVEKVIYSKDNSKRYVILKNDKGFFTYRFEKIYQFDEEDLNYINSSDFIPGFWTDAENGNTSIFHSLDDALKELEQEGEYKLFYS